MTATLIELDLPLTELAAHWPTASVPELLARAEELIALSQDLVAARADPADYDAVIFDRIRNVARTLDTLDQYGMLRGPTRARYQAAILAAARL